MNYWQANRISSAIYTSHRDCMDRENNVLFQNDPFFSIRNDNQTSRLSQIKTATMRPSIHGFMSKLFHANANNKRIINKNKCCTLIINKQREIIRKSEYLIEENHHYHHHQHHQQLFLNRNSYKKLKKQRLHRCIQPINVNAIQLFLFIIPATIFAFISAHWPGSIMALELSSTMATFNVHNETSEFILLPNIFVKSSFANANSSRQSSLRPTTVTANLMAMVNGSGFLNETFHLMNISTTGTFDDNKLSNILLTKHDRDQCQNSDNNNNNVSKLIMLNNRTELGLLMSTTTVRSIVDQILLPDNTVREQMAFGQSETKKFNDPTMAVKSKAKRHQNNFAQLRSNTSAVKNEIISEKKLRENYDLNESEYDNRTNLKLTPKPAVTTNISSNTSLLPLKTNSLIDETKVLVDKNSNQIVINTFPLNLIINNLTASATLLNISNNVESIKNRLLVDLMQSDQSMINTLGDNKSAANQSITSNLNIYRYYSQRQKNDLKTLLSKYPSLRLPPPPPEFADDFDAGMKMNFLINTFQCTLSFNSSVEILSFSIHQN